MANDLHHLFKTSTNPGPIGALGAVMERITLAKRQAEKQRRIFWGTLSCVSLGATFFAGVSAAGTFSQSGFGTFFSLIFSDGSAVISGWKELFMSLVESLPILESALFVGTIALLVWSLRGLFKNNATPLAALRAL